MLQEGLFHNIANSVMLSKRINDHSIDGYHIGQDVRLHNNKNKKKKTTQMRN